MVICLVVGYAAYVGIYLVSGANGGYDPVVGTMSVAIDGSGTNCATEVEDIPVSVLSFLV